MTGGLAMPVPTAKGTLPPLLEIERRSGRREQRTSPSRPPPAVHVAPRLIAFEDGMMFLSYAAQALSRDEFSKCFEPRPTRKPKSILLYWLYLLGVLVRYGILFPIRLGVFLLASLLFLLLLGPAVFLQSQRLLRLLFRVYCYAWLFAFSAIIHHHGKKPNPDEPHLFVANHTSFIDYFLMSSCGIPHATVAQVHGGLFGWFQRYALSANGSLFFNRNENKDRLAVARRMQAHINQYPRPAPLIIFPEGTCVNNEATVLFHKGSFALEAWICPVAIKYNKRLLDPYWNTREQTFTQHALYLMTRWLMVADVWWLPPMQRGQNESPIMFADRVKALISNTAGLKNLSWDGYMKNCMRDRDQERMRKSTQEKYVSSLRRRLTPAGGSSESLITNESSTVKPFTNDTVEDSNLPSEAIIVDPSPGPGRRRSNSVAVADHLKKPILTNHHSPSSIPLGGPYLPPWLSDTAVVDIQNELLLAENRAAGDPALALVNHIRAHKDDVVQTWRFYSRLARQGFSPTCQESQIAERRLENSSWRFWFKQRLEQSGPSPPPILVPKTVSAPPFASNWLKTDLKKSISISSPIPPL